MQEFLENINWGIIAPLFFIQGLLLIFAILDWAKADNFRGPKWMWFCIIVFINIVGPVVYFLFGRRRN
ncbi:PLD nuclease N-terminal domain-containing protein [Oceanobacillus bengalensis]|uniref:PLDc_N domain-containing protein n=1 Tax=Oceanobacillus bengalensis TaxID=1435466 RepID=A0A494YW79_9BACI|nr:PLD nuclease N-terminal domain-containing protein [Oceanobacillus bengalensis]RKQ14367.1 PLDc_N domain-containing protein [Oceanobacillus bengalensis]